jgi:predicted AlkP superfamily phosphohydrolase/phosphomutase
MDERLVIIGLDGGTFKLLDPFMQSGIMPRMKAIVEKGCRAILKSTRPPITACAWPTMYTAGEPGQHSVFDFRRPLRNPDLKRRFINSSSIRMPKIWEILAEEGHESILLNLPLTYPAFEMKGRMIAGMPLPADAPKICYPDGLIDEVKRECGGYIPDIDFLRGEIPDVTNADAVDQLLGEIRDALKYRLLASQYLMSKGNWRLFFSCFILPDRIQHIYYSLLDDELTKEKTLSDVEKKLKAKLVDLYAELDDAIGKLADSISENDTLVFVSDHGFGPLKRIFHLNVWLRNAGYLKFTTSRARSTVGRFLPEAVKRPLRVLMGRSKDGSPVETNPLERIDWSVTRAYCGSSTEQGVYLNVKGREPYGIVEQGMEYIKIRDELIDALKQAIDPVTGGKVFDVVLPRDEIQTGRFSENAPDIYIQPAGYETVMAEEYVEDVSIPWHHPWGGFHREEGIFIATGPGIESGTKHPPIEMTRILPTFLTMLNLPIPDWVTSTIPEGLLTKEFLDAHPIVIKSYPELLAKYEETDTSDDEDTGGEDLLKGLGYVN